MVATDSWNEVNGCSATLVADEPLGRQAVIVACCCCRWNEKDGCDCSHDQCGEMTCLHGAGLDGVTRKSIQKDGIFSFQGREVSRFSDGLLRQSLIGVVVTFLLS